MAKPFLSIIVPVRNEEQRLPLMLVDMDKRLSEVEHSGEILVVDAASSDRTREVASRFSELVRNVRYIRLEGSAGVGDAIRRGMEEARGSYRLLVGADNAVAIDRFEAMIPLFKEGKDVVVCSRYDEDSHVATPLPFFARVAARLENVFARITLLRDIKDIQSGYVALTEEAAQDIMPRTVMHRRAVYAEMLVLAHALGYRIQEISATWEHDVRARTPLSSRCAYMWEITKVRVRLWRRSYRIEKVSDPSRHTANDQHEGYAYEEE